ncbi:MAG TPA: CBS domain-containing protein [Polyangia bacterium]|jgi:CBS-domain-containing membrane protein|nr:CBS domain-containing protein [Polyangia bacterium]
MKCQDIMSKNLEWLNEKDTVRHAAAIMAEAGIGFLPIIDKWKKVVGVVTDRDLTTRALAKKIDPDKTSATLVMTTPAITLLETADVRDAEALMAEERKVRLVITDAEGKLAGILSLADLVEHASGRESLKTVRAVLWREALGPRGGATRADRLLKDDPAVHKLAPESDDVKVRPTVFTGGHRGVDTKEFPG